MHDAFANMLPLQLPEKTGLHMLTVKGIEQLLKLFWAWDAHLPLRLARTGQKAWPC